MSKPILFLLAAFATVFLSSVVNTSLRAATSVHPNIIVIMADDLGYGDVSCNGATALQTPNIDKLAAGGLRFTDGYCSASTCTPTRYSFLTGDYAFRTKGTGIAPPNAPAIIKPGTETVASLLAKAGYATGVVGKWHLGLGGNGGPDWNGELKPGPLEIGFDSCFLLPTTNDRVPQVYVQDHRVPNLDPADPLWVGNKKPSKDYPTGVSERDSLRMDWSQGHIEPGVSDAMVCTIDLAASLAAIAGQEVPGNACQDSVDVSGALLGRDGSQGRESLVQQDNGNRGNFGYRKGKWKLQRHDSGREYNVVVEEPLKARKVPEFMLFDLDEDPAEQHNVIDSHPEIAVQMKTELAEIVERDPS